MSPPRKNRRAALLAAGVGALLATSFGLILLLHPKLLGIFHAVHLSYDIPFHFRKALPQTGLVLIYMDDESHRDLQQPYLQPWNRSTTHARLLERLNAEDANAAVFDIIFGKPGNAEEDAHLVQAMKTFGKVVLGAEALPVGSPPPGLTGTQFNLPNELFANAAAAIGSSTLPVDSDQAIRRHPRLNGHDIVPSISWAAARIVHGPAFGADWPTNQSRWVNYYGPPATLPSVSYAAALDTNKVPTGYFRHKVVFIGANYQREAPGAKKDQWLNPASGGFLPGVAVQATLYQNLVHRDFLVRAESIEFILILAAGLIFGAGLPWLAPSRIILLGLFSLAAIAVAGCWAQNHTGAWLAWVILELQIAAAMVWGLLFSYMKTGREAKPMEAR